MYLIELIHVLQCQMMEAVLTCVLHIIIVLVFKSSVNHGIVKKSVIKSQHQLHSQLCPALEVHLNLRQPMLSPSLQPQSVRSSVWLLTGLGEPSAAESQVDQQQGHNGFYRQ